MFLQFSMAPNKQRVAAEDFRLQARRHNVPFRWHPQHPVRTVTAQRLLVACPEGAKRSALMHDLYRSYWVLNEDVADDAVLAKYVRIVSPVWTVSCWEGRAKPSLSISP